MHNLHALKRMATPDEIAQSALYLASDASSFTTGSAMLVDGEGWILEITDEFGNSTVWDEPFDTDAAALKEAKSTLRDEGIDSLIGMDQQ